MKPINNRIDKNCYSGTLAITKISKCKKHLYATLSHPHTNQNQDLQIFVPTFKVWKLVYRTVMNSRVGYYSFFVTIHMHQIPLHKLSEIPWVCNQGVSEVQFCTTERPQLFEFEVATCRTCRLRSKKAILEVATSNLKK